jgi:BirA family transcriptional regulator, biotin operon repressor / biotin---[acetyl-CoA-carboxylase] ligase
MNSNLFAGLRCLSHEAFRAGPEIAKTLGVSRATLSNHLKETEQFGVEIYKVHGRGYRLARPLDWLAYPQIIEALGTMAKLFNVEICDTSPSTNTVLMERAVVGAPSGTVLAAEFQSDGRGRRGRSWFAPLCGGVTFSLLWRFNQGASRLSCLSLAVGVAVARTLRDLGLNDVQLKWPNDILHRFHKLGGILIELTGDVLGPTFAVIGIGVNVRLDDSSLTKINQATTDLSRLMETMPPRSLVLGKLLAELGRVLPQFETEGFSPFRDEWTKFHAYQNRPVRMVLPRNTIEEGIVSGVADDGSLILDRPGGASRYTVGEISLSAAS